MATILIKPDGKGRVSLTFDSGIKGHSLTWRISADLRKAVNREMQKTLGAKYVEEFNRP